MHKSPLPVAVGCGWRVDERRSFQLGRKGQKVVQRCSSFCCFAVSIMHQRFAPVLICTVRPGMAEHNKYVSVRGV
jgi:hypothetical protein